MGPLGDLWNYKSLISITFAVLITTAHSAPTSNPTSTCTSVCKQDAQTGRLKYEEGKTYTYEFDTQVVTKLVGTTDEESKIGIKGHALISATSSCELLLTLQNVEFIGRQNQQIESNQLDGSSIKFTLEDGSIENICTSDGDSPTSANIKRALVSMLQNKALQGPVLRDGIETTITELDVSGRCPTVYLSTDSMTKFTKTRILNRCSYRDGGFWVLQGVPYQTESNRNSVPLFNSSSTCNQSIENEIIESVECEEVHKLRPLSSGSSGAVTEIKSQLKFKSVANGIKSNHVGNFESSTILFDHAQKYSIQDLNRITTLLKSICSQRSSSNIPNYLQKLRKFLTGVSLNNLNDIYTKIENGEMCQASDTKFITKLFFDTLAKVGTPDSTTFVANQIVQGNVDESTRHVFSLYATYSTSPTEGNLKAFAEIIGSNKLDSELILSASGIAYRYCYNTNQDCSKNPEYIALVNSISQIASESCTAQESGSVDLAVVALQALGNLPNLLDPAIESIVFCMQSSSERIKVRALDAFRRDPCKTKLKEKSLEVFANRKESSEVRIHAYLATTKCLTQGDIGGIQRVLDSEESNQVGSFITSHIQNMISSRSPSKADAAGFRQLQVLKSYPFDLRKFSRNFEFSKFSPISNLGFLAESNLLYSSNSYIPRSASVNLTTDIFGRSYNFLEFGVYLEDFEHLVEQYFGPVKKSLESDVTDNSLHQRLSRFTADISSRLKREISAETSRQLVRNRIGSSGLGDIYVRVMGTTLLSKSFTQHQLKESELRNEFFSMFDKFLIDAKDHNLELTEPLTFIDDELVVPTISGLPLNLGIEGTSVVSVELKGKLDIKNILRNEASNIESRVIPSASTLIKVKMTVGSLELFESGIKLEGKVHTSSGVDLGISRENGKFEVKLNLPEEKVQTVEIKSELFWVNGEAEEKPLRANRIKSTFNRNACQVSSLVGLKFCTQATLPSFSGANQPYFPLSGDAVIAVSIEKLESSMEGYYFSINTNNENQKSLSLVFDTPGSKTNRRITAEGIYVDGQSPKIDLDIQTPATSVKLNYQRFNEDSLKGLEVKIITGEESEYSLISTMKTSGSEPEGISYEPLLSYSTPDAGVVKFLEGKVTHQFGKKLEADLQLAGPTRSLQGKLTGSVVLNQQENSNELDIPVIEFENGVLGKLILVGNAAMKETANLINLNVKYGKQTQQHDLSLKAEYANPDPKQTKFELAVASTRREFLNFDVKYNSLRNNNGIENSLLITRGTDEAEKFILSQSSKIIYESSKLFDISNILEVTYPKRGINFYLTANGKGDAKDRTIDFQTRVGQDISATFKYGATGETFGSYDVTGLVKFPGNTFRFSENAKELSSGKWKYKTLLSADREGKTPFLFEGDTDLTFQNEKSNSKSELISRISSSLLEETYTFQSSVNLRKEAYQANLKLSKPSSEILNLFTEYRTALGTSPSKFTSKVFVSNYINGVVEEIHDKASSKFKMDYVWIPNGRQIVSNSNLKKQNEAFSWDADFKWDASRDLTQAVSINSVTSLKGRSTGIPKEIESKNILTFQGVERAMNLVGKFSGSYFNGENFGEVAFRTGSNKVYSLGLTLKNDYNERQKSSRVGLKFVHPDRTSPFEIEATSRAGNIDFSKYLFDFRTDVQLKYNSDPDIRIVGELKSTMTNKRAMSAVFDMSGGSIANPVKIDLSSEIQKGSFKAAAAGKHGTKATDFELEAVFDKWSAKKTLELNYKLSSPLASLRNLEGKLKYGFLWNSWNNFEIVDVGSITVNRKMLSSWERSTVLLNNDLNVKYNIAVDDQPVVDFGVKGLMAQKKLTLKISNILHGSESKVNFELDRNSPNNIKSSLALQTPYSNFEKLEFNLRHKISGASNYMTQFQATRNDDTVSLTSKLQLGDEKKGIELVASESGKVRKFAVIVSGINTEKYTVDTLLIWGEKDKFISSKGNLLRSEEAVGGDLTLHSPALKFDNWNVEVTKKIDKDTGKNQLSFYLKSGAGKEHGSLVLDYKTKRNESIVIYDGSISTKSAALDFSGNFELEDKLFTLTRDYEDGRQLKATLTFSIDSPIVLVLQGKKTTAEKGFTISFCNEGGQVCKIGKLSHELYNEPEKKGFSFNAITKSVSEDTTITDGLVITALTQSESFDHSIKLLSSSGGEDEQEIGYKVFSYPKLPQPKSGIEIQLPERELSFLHTLNNKENAIEVWLDKTRHPDAKLNIKVSTDPENLYFIMQHPSLKSDLKILSQAVFNKGDKIADVKLDLYVFKGPDPLSASLSILNQPAVDDKVSRAVNINFKGFNNLALGIKSDLQLGRGEFLAKTKMNYLNRDQRQREYEFTMEYGPKKRNIDLTGPSGVIARYSSVYADRFVLNNIDGYDVRREIFLPGMKDTGIFQNTLTTSFPQNTHIKMFTSTSLPDSYYEAWIGFQSIRSFMAGVYHRDGQVQGKTLGEFNIALNNSRLMLIKSKWDKENIQQFLDNAEDRLRDTANRFKSLSETSTEYLEQELKHVQNTFKDSSPNLTPFFKYYKSQYEQILEEIESAEVVDHFGHYLEFAFNLMGTDTESVKSQLKSLFKYAKRMGEGLSRIITSVPDYITQAVEVFPSFIKTGQRTFNNLIDGFIEAFQMVSKGVKEGIKRLGGNSTDNDIEVGPLPSAVGNYVKEVLNTSVNFLVSAWESTQEYIDPILSTETVKSYIKFVSGMYEKLAAEIVDEYKTQANSIRESIFQALPHNEAKDFVQAMFEYVEKKVQQVPVNDTATREDIYNKLIKALRKIQSNLFDIDLKNGNIAAQIPLPVPIRSLTEITQAFRIPISYQPPRFKTPSYTYGLSEAYNTLVNTGSFKELIPPFRAVGLIIGSEQYKTFDGKFYRFKGEKCSYVLTTDLLDQNFTITIDYVDKLKKSIVVESGADRISMEPDHTVLINRNPGSIPSTSGNLKVEYYKDWIVVTGTSGFVVKCSVSQDVCAVELSGFYHGRTGGLLGTYNNEYFDDLLTLELEKIDDTPEIALQLWKEDGKCEETKSSGAEIKPVDPILNKMCYNGFSSKYSNLRPCFGVVNPNEYQEVCESLDPADSTKSLCTTAYAYRTMCQDSGIIGLYLPEICTRK